MDKETFDKISDIIEERARYKAAIETAIAEFEKAPYDRLRNPYDILKEAL